ncbi:MAG: ABC transporter ATP-binding protein [Bacillota bacterium]|nr:ABC transporter ATP-binding protein [Bacillota bacterium]
MSILLARDLAKCYGSGTQATKAVDGVTFSVEKGEFIAVIGRSGCGKTTLLHMLGGLETPDSGKVEISGQDIFSMSKEDLTVFRRQNIGFVFQAYNLLPILDVFENIVLPLRMDGREAEADFFNEIVGMLELEDKLLKLPSQLSGGEQQRTAIARSLITQPALLLADEPTGNLDSQTSANVLALLKDTGKRFGQTVVMVTHSMDIARTADRIIEMADGTIKKVHYGEG